MIDQGKNILIGAFVLAAICLLVFLVLFLHPSPGDESQILTVRFNNIEGIQEGSRVNFAGQPVGKVDKIIDVWGKERPPHDYEGPMYFFEVVLAIDSAVRVYDTDDITIQAKGFFGDRNISILPRRPPEGVVPERITKESIVYADQEGGVEQALGELVGVADKMGSTFDKMSALIDANAEEINLSIRTFQQSMSSFGTTWSDINENQVVTIVADAISSIDVLVDGIQGHMKELEAEGFWDDVSKTAANIAKTTKNLREITTDVANGDSTIGRLLTEDDLYLDFKSVMAKADTTMNDINHYGLLFSQNRQWQRERTKRANMMEALCTVEGFRNYVGGEVDRINTAVSRLYVVMEETRCSQTGRALMCNPCFMSELADALRHISSLEERLELYNQQLQHEYECASCQ